MLVKKFVMTLALAALAVTPAFAGDAVGDPYALNVCAVSGEELGSMGDPIVIVHEGREIKFCCSGCEPKFEADPAKYIAKVDEKMTEMQKASYPGDTCIVSGKAATTSKVIANRLMKFCCENCPKAAAGDPAKFIAKLDEAVIEAQSKDYKATTCPVSGKELGSMGDPINLVVANQLVKICCAGCEKKVMSNPAEMISKVNG